VFPAEHLLDLARLHFGIEGFEAGRELGVYRLARLGPFDQDREVVVLLLERENEIAILLDAAAALLDFLRFRLILPEVRSGGAYVEAGQFFVRPGLLKDSSADRQPAC